MQSIRSDTTPSLLQIALENVVAKPALRTNTQAREARIMASVLLECALHGPTKAKMTQIASRARVSTATLYREYSDRDALFCKALELGLSLLTQVWRPQELQGDPLVRLEELLRAHARNWSDPFLAWLIRMYIQFSSSKAPHLLALGRAARASNLQFWAVQINAMEESGDLVSGHTQTIIALALGAVERRTALARLGFGEDDCHEPAVIDVIPYAARAIFQVFGTQAFWSNRADQRAPGWCGDGRTAFAYADLETSAPTLDFWSVRAPKALLDMPSTRLETYANRVLAQEYDRLDTQSRNVRIQLATMLECIDKGYEGVGMADIAARAHVSTATLYQTYSNREELFLDTIILQARLRVDFTRLIDPNERFQDVITDINFSITNVLADPKFLWFHYASMASELSGSPELIASSRQTRAHTEGFWIDYFNRLTRDGQLPSFDVPLILNMLLGITQRRSIQSLVLFGADDTNSTELARLAQVASEFILRLIGPTTRANQGFASQPI